MDPQVKKVQEWLRENNLSVDPIVNVAHKWKWTLLVRAYIAFGQFLGIKFSPMIKVSEVPASPVAARPLPENAKNGLKKSFESLHKAQKSGKKKSR